MIWKSFYSSALNSFAQLYKWVLCKVYKKKGKNGQNARKWNNQGTARAEDDTGEQLLDPNVGFLILLLCSLNKLINAL